MNKSDTIGKLAAALAKAQGEMEPAKKESRGNFGAFADLGDVIDAIRKVSTPNGLSFAQFPVGDAAGMGVTTILMHDSGEWLSDSIYLPISEEMSKRNGAQLAGINITYLRRYALAAAFGVYADVDTDGSQPRNQQAPQPVRNNPPRPEPAVTPLRGETVTQIPAVNLPAGDVVTRNRTGGNGNTAHTQEEFVALVRSSKLKNSSEIVKAHTANGATDWHKAYLELEGHAKALA
jgi:hypothetical protein